MNKQWLQDWARRLRPLTTGVAPVIFMGVLMLVSLSLLSEATENSAKLGRLYVVLVALNVLGLAVMIGLIAANLYSLITQYQRKAVGSRLTMRLVLVFVILAVTPVSIVYYFSLGFLQSGIDSWFEVHTEKSMEDALELSRSALDLRLRELLRQTRLMSDDLVGVSDAGLPLTMDGIRFVSEATDLTLVTQSGRVLASSSADTTAIIPKTPDDAILSQVKASQTYIGLSPQQGGLQARVAVGFNAPDPTAEPRVLYAVYPIGGRISELADQVQASYGRYKELAFLREPLKNSFILTLSLVLLVSLFTAVWGALYSARRLVEPVRALAIGTRAVSEGIYTKKLPESSRDELGVLVRSFNEMTEKIAQARDDVRRSQRQADRERAYLRAMLGRLSSGVLTLDRRQNLRAVNNAASQIVGIDFEAMLGSNLDALKSVHPFLEPLVAVLAPHLAKSELEWREEVRLIGKEGHKILTCRGASLPMVEDMPGGYVVVFDDVTALIQAQRDAAWGEVARRLAHEIKNPLTPIQLSAERLRRRYLTQLPPDDAEVLDRATHTIVQQVESMKEMVQAFSEYARTPVLALRPLNLADLIEEVLELYRGHSQQVKLEMASDPGMPLVEADPDRLRQLLHNLLTNAIEATRDVAEPKIDVGLHSVSTEHGQFVEFRITDNGHSIPMELLNNLFEPYVTTKMKGSGIGLAVVKRIVEEHAGTLWAENPPGGGACLTVRLPAAAHAQQSEERVARGS